MQFVRMWIRWRRLPSCPDCYQLFLPQNVDNSQAGGIVHSGPGGGETYYDTESMCSFTWTLYRCIFYTFTISDYYHDGFSSPAYAELTSESTSKSSKRWGESMETLVSKAPSHLICVTTNQIIDQISDLITPKITFWLSLLDQIFLTTNVCNIHQYVVALLQ